MNTLYNKILRKGLILFSFLLLTNVLNAQTFLEIPVKLEVEKGDMNDIVVKVKKDGKDAFTQSGASKMRFKFDYNRKYSLIFTKPGYVTKTIEINTSAPSARISQGFDPYKIGVKLFKQGEENTVVYNQPVAHIKYDQNLDEFNFDTDYSKSILSAMNSSDDADKKEEAPLSRETESERTQNTAANTSTETAAPAIVKPDEIKAPPHAVETAVIGNKQTPTIVSAEEKPEPVPPSAGNEVAVINPPSNGEDVTKKPEINSGEDILKKSTASYGEDQTNKAKENSGEEHSKKSSGTSGEDHSKKSKMNSGADFKVATNGESGNDKRQKRLSVTQSEEKPFVPLASSDGSDQQGNPDGFMNREKITREDIVERNRVITKVTVMKGNTTTEYSRINYKWGGLYFFKNSAMSIPENLFVQWTGVSREN